MIIQNDYTQNELQPVKLVMSRDYIDSNTNTKSLEVYKPNQIKPTRRRPSSIWKHAPSGRSYLCRRTVGKNGRRIIHRMIIQNELQPVKLVMSRDYIYYSNTTTVKMDGGWTEDGRRMYTNRRRPPGGEITTHQ